MRWLDDFLGVPGNATILYTHSISTLFTPHKVLTHTAHIPEIVVGIMLSRYKSGD